MSNNILEVKGLCKYFGGVKAVDGIDLQIPKNTIVIHGEVDETIQLGAVFEWLKDQEIVAHVIPGADHFFHRKLHLIRDTVISLWHDK